MNFPLLIFSFRGLDCGELKYARIIELLGPKYIALINAKNVPSGQFGSWRYY